YGKSDRIWVMDRGMVSEENIEFLKEEGRRYIIGATKSHLKKFEQQLLAADWHTVHEGVEVKLCQSPDGDEETFILCRTDVFRHGGPDRELPDRSVSGILLREGTRF